MRFAIAKSILMFVTIDRVQAETNKFNEQV